MASGARGAQKFLGDIHTFSEVTGQTVTTIVRYIALDLYARITKRTPVDTGRARAAWGISINSIPDTTPPIPTEEAKGKLNREIEEGKTRDASHVNASGELPDLTGLVLGDIVYIFNNVKYIVYLEEGTSKQAPAGMVAISMAEVKTELDAIIRANTPDNGGNS